MRRFVFAALSAVASLGVTGSISTAAAAREYPYCLQGRHWGYPGNCQFSTYEQCMATASGTLSYCGVNPRFAYGQQRRGYRPY
jgi:uncharacterized protein DUF3551